MGLEEIKALVTSHPDFPKAGILFRDIFPVLRNPQVFEDLLGLLVSHIKEKHCQNGEKVDVIVGLDSRGFLFGPIIALRLGASFVPIRKKGKLPGKIESLSYKLEYGEASFDIQTDSIQPGQKVIVIDDLIATGGTMTAACQLVERIGGTVVEALLVIELVDLQGHKKLDGRPFFSLMQY